MQASRLRWTLPLPLLVLLALLALAGPASARQGKQASFRSVDRVMSQGVKDRTFQSAVLLVSHHGRFGDTEQESRFTR